MIPSNGSLNIRYLSTLPRYTSFTNIKTGFDPDIIERLVPEIKLKEIKDHEGNCSMLLNKMKRMILKDWCSVEQQRKRLCSQ